MRITWLLGLGLLAVTGCGSSSTRENADGKQLAEPAGDSASLEHVTLLLNWFPEAEHGGYYAAQVNGYYRDAGLDVEIRPSGPDAKGSEISQIASGRVQFGVLNADNVLFGRAQEAPVVAVMAPLQTSPRCILVHEKSGIKNFDELRNVTLAIEPGAAFADFLRRHAPLTGVKIVPYTGNVQQFLLDEHFGQQGYVFSEPYVARKNGADPRVLMLSDLGFNPYTSLLATSEALIAEKPELVQRMVTASVRGWQSYLDNPEQTNRRIQKLNPVMDMAALDYGAQQIVPLVWTTEAKTQGLGTMTAERWTTLAKQLVETGQLRAGAVDPLRAFTDRFLPQAEPAATTSGKKPD